jgi:ferric-dicitrate binding protein FerR (iron transport regulator)
MSDWFSTAVELQREIVRAQRAQIDAAGEMLKAGERLQQMQEAGTKAAEANVRAWRAWAKLWGWK